jgi:hypothetical protein
MYLMTSPLSNIERMLIAQNPELNLANDDISVCCFAVGFNFVLLAYAKKTGDLTELEV